MKKKPKYFAKCVPKKVRNGTGNTLTRMIWPPRGLTPKDMELFGHLEQRAAKRKPVLSPVPHKFTFESMTAVYVGNYRVRIWRTETECGKITDADLRQVTKAIRYKAGQSPAVILQTLAALPDVAAVECVDHDGDGALVYVDWDKN